MWELIKSLMTNQVFIGIVGAGVMATFAMMLRQFGPQLFRIFREQFMTTVTIYSTDKMFHSLQRFMTSNSYLMASRTNTVTEWWCHVNSIRKWGLIPGSGWHSFRHNRDFFFFSRTIGEPPAGTSYTPRPETMTIYSFGRSANALNRLMTDVHTDTDREEGYIKVQAWDGNSYNAFSSYIRKRDMDSVFIPQAQKDRIIGDVLKFEQDREQYHRRGTPYRRGYMLYGPPGTGKTTMVLAIASFLDREICIINPSVIASDLVLAKAFNDAGTSIIIIEDIDTIDVSHSRLKVSEADTSDPGATADVGNGITLSGLLNAIDGITSVEGRLLFITTNHPEKLDAALTRPGRIDLKEQLGLMQLPEAVDMFKRFYPTGNVATFTKFITPQLPLAPAYVQGLLLAYEEPPEAALQLISNEVEAA